MVSPGKETRTGGRPCWGRQPVPFCGGRTGCPGMQWGERWLRGAEHQLRSGRRAVNQTQVLWCWGFPGGAVVRESTCQHRTRRRRGFDPWVGKIPWKRTWQPTPVFLPGKSHGQRSLVDYSPCNSPRGHERVGHDWIPGSAATGITVIWCLVVVQLLSRVLLFVTPRAIAHQVPLSVGFSRQQYWSGLPFPPPGDLPDSGIKPRSPALQVDTLLTAPPGKSSHLVVFFKVHFPVCFLSAVLVLDLTSLVVSIHKDRQSRSPTVLLRGKRAQRFMAS